jgi:hypothetical protein
MKERNTMPKVPTERRHTIPKHLVVNGIMEQKSTLLTCHTQQSQNTRTKRHIYRRPTARLMKRLVPKVEKLARTTKMHRPKEGFLEMRLQLKPREVAKVKRSLRPAVK